MKPDTAIIILADTREQAPYRFEGWRVEAGAVRDLANAENLFPWIDTGDRAGQTKFSRMLSRNARRSFGGLALHKREAGQGHTYWRVAPAEG